MPVSTDHLADDVKDPRESNEHLAEAIRDLGRDLGNFRVEVAEKLGAINANLEAFRGRTETSLRMAAWGIGILAPLIITLVWGGFWIRWHAAKLDSRVERVESRLDKEPTMVPATKAR